MEWYGVDLDVIRRYICTENRCCILRSEPTIAHIFSELYTAHSVPDTGYLRLKVLELLHILTRLKNREDVQQTEYFNQHQVECVKQAAALLTQELTVRRTIEQLAQEVGLSPTALKSVSKAFTEARSMRIRKSTGCSWHRSYYSKPIARLLKSPIGSGTKIRISFLLHFGKQPA